MARSRKSKGLATGAVSVEGSLIAPAMLARIAAHEADGQKEADYAIPKGLTLRDEIARYFRIGQAQFQSLMAADAPSTSKTVAFTESLLRDVLGFTGVQRVGTRTQDGRQYAVTLEAVGGRVPVVVVPPSDELDRASTHLPSDGRKRSAASAIQDWLNANDNALWGFACNGERLRLVRDNSSLTRPAYIEANLRQIFEAEDFAGFTALWLLAHASRFGGDGDVATNSHLERWRDAGSKEGLAARERLRIGVEDALRILGHGLVSHPANDALRVRLDGDALPLNDFFGQLLRTVYRLIFLLAAEDRDLLHPPSASAAARRLYAEGYSLRALRDRSVRRAAWDRYDDKWQGLQITFASLARGEPALGLPGLGGLFMPDAAPDIDAATLSNKTLLEAIFRLAWLRDDAMLSPVNWRDMETEELGSVYESLLELTPRRTEGGRGFAFAEGAETKGNARKTSGSYYTPDSLVQTLLDSALDPVLDRVEAEAEDPAAALLTVTVVDPACGSGHFLLAAARRIATRVARARAGGVASAEDFRHALRDVARTCIYGVDRNPMAVELTKVALWIETVDPGKPLGFLDANIRCGDALLGVFDLEVLRQGVPDAAYKPLAGDNKAAAKHFASQNKAERKGQGTFDFAGGGGALPPPPPLAGQAAALRTLPEETPEQVTARAKAWRASRDDRRFVPWSVAADLYVAAFLTPKTAIPENSARGMVPTTTAVWRAIRSGGLPGTGGGSNYGPMEGKAVDLARTARAFHWPLEFPDVFSKGGFDAVLGNPPWERIKLQEQEFFAARDPEIAEAPNAAARQKLIRALAAAPEGSRERALHAEFEIAKRVAEASSVFARLDGADGGRFPLSGRGDVNTYALFAELCASLTGLSGRSGVIVPTGIATDATTAPFFAALIDGKRVASLFDFENRDRIFPAVDSRMKFCLLTLGQGIELAAFAFFLTEPAQLAEPHRRFTLSPEEIARINPNTKTAPLFRSCADAELTARIYARVPVLVDERRGAAGNPWGAQYLRLIDFGDHKDELVTADQAVSRGYSAALPLWVGKDPVLLPVWESKLTNTYDLHYATFVGFDDIHALSDDHKKPEDQTHRYWVSKPFFESVIEKYRYTRSWLLAYRDVARATDERTLIALAIPRQPATRKLPVLGISEELPAHVLLAIFNSLVLDYLARQKIGGISAGFFILKQLPVPPPAFVSEEDTTFITSRVLELTYTSYAMASFARDVGYDGPPFAWNPDRRAHLRAELDARIARLYGLTRDELRYILDPADVMGADYPSETFRVLKKNEIAKFGEYRTQGLVLAAWDAEEAALRIGGVAPAIQAVALKPRESIVLANVAADYWSRPPGDVNSDAIAMLAALLKALDGPTSARDVRRAYALAFEPRLLTALLAAPEAAQWRRVVGQEAEPLTAGVTPFRHNVDAAWDHALNMMRANGHLVEQPGGVWQAGAGLDQFWTASWPDGRAQFALSVLSRLATDAFVKSMPADVIGWTDEQVA